MTRTLKPKRKPAGNAVRVLVIDDHPLVRQGLRQLIESEDSLIVCGEAADTTEALRLIEAEEPDLALVDISLRSGNGIELIKQIKARRPEVKTLVYSMHDETLYAERALHAGAMGYVNKEELADTLMAAVRQVLQGGIHLSPRMIDRVLHRVAQGGEGRLPHNSIENLSNRELEVFELIGRAQTTREIAKKLHLSIKTVETHRENIKNKLNLSNSAELARHAVQWVLEGNTLRK
jgi:DNA-binding NarL/FixJ family response regulator